MFRKQESTCNFVLKGKEDIKRVQEIAKPKWCWPYHKSIRCSLNDLYLPHQLALPEFILLTRLYLDENIAAIHTNNATRKTAPGERSLQCNAGKNRSACQQMTSYIFFPVRNSAAKEPSEPSSKLWLHYCMQSKTSHLGLVLWLWCRLLSAESEPGVNPVQRSGNFFLGLHLTQCLQKPKEEGKTWNLLSVVLPSLKSNWPLTSALQGQDSYYYHNKPVQSSAVERWSNPFWEVFITTL